MLGLGEGRLELKLVTCIFGSVRELQAELRDQRPPG